MVNQEEVMDYAFHMKTCKVPTVCQGSQDYHEYLFLDFPVYFHSWARVRNTHTSWQDAAIGLHE
jgi:hypothetical protein